MQITAQELSRSRVNRAQSKQHAGSGEASPLLLSRKTNEKIEAPQKIVLENTCYSWKNNPRTREPAAELCQRRRGTT